MKNLFNLKHLAALLLLCITITSCEKDKDEPAPDLATKVSGTYTFSELEFDGQTVPADKSDLKGNIKITRKTETTVDAELDIRSKSTGDDFMVYDVNDIKLSEDGSTIDLVYDGERVAQIKGKKIIINATDDVGTDFTLTATR
ncbi:hypothetical protein [Dyadobacter sp. CY326]|uniref:hypothetical protein n=1 Tax=Dyadobacter sp. CY326 TaxID=2907300 RepID=UPI001F47AA90|nr:hypothetical protein [Dyadobacter sp. CY326]MCE7064996.1 hypothetical protein [Dyadobacter sp. CY326]